MQQEIAAEMTRINFRLIESYAAVEQYGEPPGTLITFDASRGVIVSETPDDIDCLVADAQGLELWRIDMGAAEGIAA